MSPRGRFALIITVYFAVLVVALFGVDLLWRPRAVVSGADQDIDRQFYPWREFAFREWRATGRPPTWNPYAFGGVPALGNVQYALLYPPNWLHLLLPTGWAINLVAAFHLWLTGVLTAAWCRSRAASTVACLVGGTIFTLSGPVMLHLYAGHLTYLCVVAWTPAILLACDRIVERRGTVWLLLGAAAVAMQLFAGYPQPAVYTAILIVPYVAARMWFSGEPHRLRAAVRALVMVAVMYVLAAGLAGAQLLPALDAARESVRATPLDFAQASTYALPPENLLTFIVPYPFGDDFSSPYTGKWLLWETSVFVGAVALTLAACALYASRGRAPDRAVAVVFVLAILFALGGFAFHVLHTLVPGVDHFRAPGRFAFLAALMLAALAAAGFDALHEARLPRLPHVVLAVIAMAGAIALWTRSHAGSAMMLAQIAVFWVLVRRVPRLAYVIPLLLLLEMWRPAARAVEWFPPRPMPAMLPPDWPDQRVLTSSGKMLNQSTRIGIEDAWGYDPATSARWADLVGRLIGADARRGDFEPTRDLAATRGSPIWPMLRVGDNPLPRVMLVSNATVAAGPSASLAAVNAPDFDPRTRVILESPPAPAPVAGEASPGLATVISRTADSLDITADLARPAILLVTDAYSAGWRVRPLETGPQLSYAVMPANHALRAIPLTAGRHHVLLEYRPSSVRIGLAVSVASVLLIALAMLIRGFKSRRDRADETNVGLGIQSRRA